MINFPTCTQQDVEAVKSMHRDERADLKKKINKFDPCNIFTPKGDNSKADKRKIICPNCGNGSGKDGTPVEVDFKDGKWIYHCFKCGNLEGDLLNLIATENSLSLNNFDDMSQALAIGANLIGYPLPEAKQSAEYMKLVHEDIEEARRHISELPESQRRGLSLLTLRNFGCGYLKSWIHPQNRLNGITYGATRRIIIPTANHYNAVVLPVDRESIDKKLWKMHTAPKELFNVEALSDDSDLILVLEGEIDAASIWQAFNVVGKKISVVAVTGVAAWKNTLLERLKGVKGKNFLIMFDGEKESHNQAEKLRGELLRRGHPAACRFFYDTLIAKVKNGEQHPLKFDEKIDANQILQQSGDHVLRILTESIIEGARDELSNALKKAEELNRAFERIAAWEKVNGKIDPQVMSELLEASNRLKSFKPLHVTAQEINSVETKRALALCKFYDAFSQDEINFFVAVKDAMTYARLAVNLAKNIGGEFVNLDDFAECKKLLDISIADLKEEVKALTKDVRKKHNAWRESERQRISREQDEKRRAEKEKREARKQSRLEELLAENPSPERDAEIIELIRESCEWRFDNRHMPVEVKATSANADKIFTNDPNLDGLFGFDEFREAPVFLKAPTWNANIKFGDEWGNDDDAQLRNYLRRVYTEFNGKHLIDDKFVEYSRKRSFHEVKNFFYDLPKWDGKPRAETLFVKFLKAEDTPYTREVTLNWLTAAVARIFKPGCKYQTALVLHGEQGIGKSFVLERLGGKWYDTLIDNVDDAHALDTIRNIWICELKEMSAMRKAELNAVKSFIERSQDSYRAAYLPRAVTYKRHCVLGITVNDRQFLNDLTGNRRFMIIVCNNKSRQYVTGLTDEYLQQVWAEVYQHYLALEKSCATDKEFEAKLELSKESQRVSDDTAELFTRNDLGEDIQTFLDTKIPPEIIWQQLTREERREFIAKGKLVLPDALLDLNTRVRARCGRKAQSIIDKLYNAMRPTNEYIKDRGDGTLWIYGAEYRQHISPQEIYTEAFDKTDRRKSLPNILAALNKISGWTLGKNFKTDPEYKNQRTVFYRDEDNNPDDE